MALLTTGNTRVEAPAFVPAKGGILDVVEVVTATPHELMGVQYESEACESVNHVALNANSCIESVAKEFDGISFQSGSPFHIYAGVTCSLFMESIDPFAAKAAVRLERGASRAIEERLWTNEFPVRAVDLTPGGVAVSPKRGLALLEEYAGSNYLGVPIIHAGRQVATYIAGETLLKTDLDEAGLVGGSGFVNGTGYVSKSGPYAATVAIAAPVITLGAASAGGTFAAGTYFWKLTALNANGETIGSNQVSATLTLNQQQVINWTAVTGATGYKLYRGTATEAQNILVATLGAVTTVTDTGTAGAAGTVPTVNTTGPVQIVATANQAWIYATGHIVIRRGSVTNAEAVLPQQNDMIVLAEQTIVPTIDCFVAAVLVNLT